LSSRYQHERSPGGLDAIRLQNDRLDLAIVPQAGGKIVDLIDRCSGRNWLWKNPHIPVSVAQRDSDFGKELDSGGWDEVLLAIKPGRIRTASQNIAAIPDHGDLLAGAWSIEDLRIEANNDLVCDMATTGRSARYRFERQLRIPNDRSVVDLSYCLRNESDEALPGYWCAHPLLAIGPDSVIEIAGNMPLRAEDAETRLRSSAHSEQRWPSLVLHDGASQDLARSFASDAAPAAFAGKIFVRSPENGVASVVLADGSRLTFRFDPEELPWLGLWINNGAWSGCGSAPYTNLGIEPTTSPYDCVNEAIENDAVPWLAPGAERRWSLQLELDQ
jgi:galactose mutarotase-like enzyme